MEKSGNIKAIDRKSIHQICSGQVVLTLATAVKELVENSVDAGATNIEVKLKEYGSELIEVCDNGSGIRECDFESLTLKHHTSKIDDFADLLNVDTFGFRGEALSSLCALSKLTVVTCHKDAAVGTRLEYDHNGAIIKQAPVARQVGTTVILENLFATLPVRHKEFQRNLRKEFGKMVHLLTAYCIISTGKRITCVNSSSKGRKTTVLSTNGDATIKGHLTCLFGNKQVNNLLEFVQKWPSEEVLEEFCLKDVTNEDIFRIEGYISSPTHGEGRSAADRQFFFINGRPCDLSKAGKVINDVYHSFNRHQYPFICLSILLTKGMIDVNVTPDKRQIFVQEEKLLLAILKASVLSIYENQHLTTKSFTSALTQKFLSSSFLNSANHKSPLLSNLRNMFSFSNKDESSFEHQPKKDSENEVVESPAGPDNEQMMSGSDTNDHSTSTDKIHSTVSLGSVVSNQLSNEIVNHTVTSATALATTDSTGHLDFSESPPSSQTVSINFTQTQLFKEEKVIDKVKIKNFDSPQSTLLKKFTSFARESTKRNSSSPSQPSPRKKLRKKVNGCKNSVDEFNIDFIIHQHKLELSNISLDDDENEVKVGTSSFSINKGESEIHSPVNHDNEAVVNTNTSCEISNNQETELICIDEPCARRKKIVPFNFSMEELGIKCKHKAPSSSVSQACEHRKFRSKLNAEDAEEELRKEISKDMFVKMDIIGQFNLGFIIAKLDEDLFIIDQHATDEKYNFEILQRDTVLETQLLLNPQKLELTAVSESILLDNMKIFECNGFKFQVNDDASVGHRVQLVSVPVSQNWTFGKGDVDELLFMLADNPGRMCRPSRVSQMFASRACRKSVMIGTPLSYQIMKKLVYHMSELEQPWNCPHGRPTMRHLLNLNLLSLCASSPE